jgi:hypothetical protein
MSLVNIQGNAKFFGKTIFGSVSETPAFTPTSISGLQLWLDASDTSTLFDATAGGNVVTTNNAAVARWADKSGNNRHFTQSTSNARPVLNLANQNNKSVLYFDGSNDTISGSVTGFKSLSATTVILVTKPLSAAAADTNSFQGWSWGVDSSPFRSLGVFATTSLVTNEKIAINISNGIQRRLGATTYSRAANTAQIITSTFSVSGTKLYANSSTVTLDLTAGTGTTTTRNSSPSAIGYTTDDIVRLNAATTSAIGPQNRICEFLIYNSVLNSTQRSDVWNYLTTKWNIA